MISHDRAQELISARMDAPLTAAEHRELNAHLAGCDACRVFVASADGLARDLHALPRLAPSPTVSRAVMAAVSAESDGWAWLRGALQALSSPGMAVASGLALVVALAGAMFLAMNAPGGGDGDGTSADAEATMAAVAVQPDPTRAVTETPEPEPTATEAPARVITGDDLATESPANTPTPKPTETRTPIVAAALPTETPVVEQAVIESPPIEPGEGPVGGGDPAIAMANEPEAAPVEEAADLAQVAEPVQTGEEASQPEAAPEAPAVSEVASEPAPESADNGNGRRDGGRRDDGGEQAAPEEPVSEPMTTETVPVPDEAITALENAGQSPNNLVLPPAPVLPMPPDQAFLPITPTPVTESTPSPESAVDGQADAPQLAEVPEADLGVTALAPEPPPADAVVTEPDVTVVEEERIRDKEKKDKSSQDGKSRENQQSAYDNYAMGWSAAPIELAQEAVLPQTADDAAATTPTETGETAVTPVPERQIDPATGLEIDPVTGLLIDPATGYLIDPATGFVYHPGTGYQVHPITGLLIDPLTGAQLDPVTLAVVIPAGFGTGTPDYNPGDPAMRGQIETVVDDNYDNATYKVIPGTDGPVQPVDEIIVPTETGEAIEVE